MCSKLCILLFTWPYNYIELGADIYRALGVVPSGRYVVIDCIVLARGMDLIKVEDSYIYIATDIFQRMAEDRRAGSNLDIPGTSNTGCTEA